MRQIQLKDYQDEAHVHIHDSFKILGLSRQYIEMPTGSGKTVTFLSYAKEYHDSSVLIIVPSIHLMNQVYETAQWFYKTSDISRKGGGWDEIPEEVHICVVHSLTKSYMEFLNIVDFDLIIIDEAHHVQSNRYKNFIKYREEQWGKDNFYILGVTATPDRLDGKLLEEMLGVCTYRLTLSEMIEMENLADIEGYRISTGISLEDIDSQNSDFSSNQLYKYLSNEHRNNIVLNSYISYLSERKTLIFCINIKHCEELNRLFKSNGISSEYISGKMSKSHQKKLLTEFKKGNIKVLFNCQLLTEGFDEPSIDGIILARPTKSKSLFFQMIGRGLRLYKGKKNCIIVDICDNHRSACSFSNVYSDQTMERINSFGSIGDLKNKVYELEENLKNIALEKFDFFARPTIEEKEAMDHQIKYLNDNQIEFYEPISFVEAALLRFMNECKKEYNGFVSH